MDSDMAKGVGKVLDLKLRVERLETALAGIVMHWREFGEMMCRDQDDYGMDERIELAARLVSYRVATKVRQDLPETDQQ